MSRMSPLFVNVAAVGEGLALGCSHPQQVRDF
jgi:hypothetical protein